MSPTILVLKRQAPVFLTYKQKISQYFVDILGNIILKTPLKIRR